MRRNLAVTLLVALAAVSFVAHADAKDVEKGSAFLSVMLSRGDVDLITPELGTGSVTAYDLSEWGGQLMYQYLLSDHWALAPSVGLGTYNETDEPGINAPGDPDFEYSQSSFNVRLGLDRFVNVGDGFALFVGPGLSFWNGSAKIESGGAEVETESTTRIALDGRLGAHVALGETFYLSGFIGQYIGHASGEDEGAEAKWSPSGTNGGMGVAFHF